MKNILLFLLLIPFSASSQQFSLEGLGNQSGVLPIDGTTDELIGYIDFTNSTTFSGTVFVRWTVESQEPSSMDYKYCWNLCYPYGTTNGTQGLDVMPGQFIEHGLSEDFSQQGFAGYYRSNEEGGTVIRHSFYDQSESFTNYEDIGYCFGATSTDDCELWNSIEQNVAGKVNFISKPYPNPSESEIRIDYLLKKFTNAEFSILSSTGNVVMTETLDRSAGTIFVNCSELASGIYLIDIRNNGASVGTQRLIVN